MKQTGSGSTPGLCASSFFFQLKELFLFIFTVVKVKIKNPFY